MRFVFVLLVGLLGRVLLSASGRVSSLEVTTAIAGQNNQTYPAEEFTEGSGEGGIGGTEAMEVDGDSATTPKYPERSATLEYTAHWIGRFILKYYLPILVPLGMIGNTMALIIMLQRKNRHIPCCVVMAALAVSDNGLLYVNAHGWARAVVLKPAIRTWADYHAFNIECKMLTYFFIVFSLTSAFLIIATTVNRFLAVVYPLQVKSLVTMRNTRMTIAAIVIAVPCYAIPYIFETDMLISELCSAFHDTNTLSRVYPWIAVVVGSVLPFVSLLAMNIAIITTLRRRNRALGGVAKTTTNKENYEMQLTVMLMLVSFIFLLLSLPQYVRYIVFNLIDYEKTPWLHAIYTMCYQISHKLYITNAGVNFFLYVVGGSKFRQDLKELFRCGKSCNLAVSANANSSKQSSTQAVELPSDVSTE